jgi:hypothetical protein
MPAAPRSNTAGGQSMPAMNQPQVEMTVRKPSGHDGH